ncbi:hypothetical protein L484_005191 [Morus notabilis]|uniref:Uncharacterized protein n=1 Tax=Morus notabilis TaxID=981085 RepID=W9QX37_9ROSA|nr:hypothetical protein L484_005191 [Morus notabilis]
MSRCKAPKEILRKMLLFLRFPALFLAKMVSCFCLRNITGRQHRETKLHTTGPLYYIPVYDLYWSALS